MILGTNTQGDGKVLVMFVCFFCSSCVYTESRSPSLLSFSSQQSNYVILSTVTRGEVCGWLEELCRVIFFCICPILASCGCRRSWLCFSLPPSVA
jgi:hypothetical protein